MTTATSTNPLEAFHWTPQPQAEKLVLELVREFLGRCPPAADLARRMKEQTGSRFHDWIETIFVPDSSATREAISRVGYAIYHDRSGEHPNLYAQPRGMFPRIGIANGN